MRIRLPVALSCGLLAVCSASLSAQVQPELMFKDTFDAAAPSDDLNDGAAGRQTGTTAPLNYATAGGGTSQLGQADAPGRLRLGSDRNVSPNHSFVEGGTFTIEFDVDPGLDDDPADGLSADWCAVVFGASTQNAFVNGSDGLGILFRNNGNIEVWETAAQGSIFAGNPGVPVPTDQPFHVRIEAQTADFKGSPATIKMFIDGQQARIDRNSLEHIKATGFRANYVTLAGYGFPGPWVHVFDNLAITAVPCLQVAPEFASIAVGQNSDPVTVTIPRQLNATQPAQMVVKSQDPTVAAPVGADASGSLALTFAAGGPTSQTFTVAAKQAGNTLIEATGPQGSCVLGNVRVVVAAGVGLSEVLFRDTFDVSAGTLDINAENSGGRQTGTAGILSYTERADTAADGLLDDYTQITQDQGPGQLSLQSLDLTWAGPDYNFIAGGRFTIGFDVNPSVLDPGRTTDDWAAVVFGALGPGRWVNGSEGIGMLFRSNGGIQVFDGTTAVYNAPAGELPEGEFRVQIDVDTPDFSGRWPAEVTLSVNGNPVAIGARGAIAYTKPTGFRANYVTLEGYAAAGNQWTYTFDDLEISALACVHCIPSRLTIEPDQTSQTVTVKVPAAFNQGQSGTVKLISLHPGIAVPAGAVNGELTLTFAAGAPTSQTVEIQAVGKGRATFVLENSRGVCVGDPLEVTVRRSLVVNPSFESNYNPTSPSYGPVDNWDRAGGGGVNQATGPFHDNGTIPDRSRVAFLQGNGTMSQTLTGLLAGKTYWVQLRYNTRNCCGTRTLDMAARFDGVDLGSVTDIQPVGAANPYGFANFSFTPQATAGLLEITTTVTGDATLLLDGVTVVQRDTGNVLVANPSFEASGVLPALGAITPLNVSSWTATGTCGVDVNGGSLANNGTNPDQDLVAFIQGPGSLSQVICGLLAGQTYTVSYAYNAQAGTTPHLKVTAGTTLLQDADVAAVGGATAYATHSATFVATGPSALLVFEQTATGNATVLLDDIKVLGQSLNLQPIEVRPTAFQLGVGQTTGNQLTVKVPPALIASSPGSVTIRSLNPAVAIPEGAVNGVLTLTFPVGGEAAQTVNLRALGLGRTSLVFENPHGLCFTADTVTVAVLGSFVKNPSFEANSHPTFPGYGPIEAWESEGPGNTGINNSTGPFHDNGVIPDRAQIALLQVDKVMRQSILGLTPGKAYWLQFYYNTRNCCGGTIDLTARFDGVDLTLIPTLTPVGEANPYNFISLEFTPTASSGVLEFSTTSAGDATALLDAVSIVQRDAGQVLLVNPSFEASGTPASPGYIAAELNLAGWTKTGGVGINAGGAGPFANNGANPDQDSVVFLQGAGSSISQVIGGLTAGQNYTARFAVNARSGNTARLKVAFDDQTAFEETITPVGGVNPYLVKQAVFKATAAEGTLRFEQVAAGDQTVLLDNITVVPGGTIEEKVSLNVRLTTAGTVRVAWPTSATGYTLQSAPAVPGGNQWANVTEPTVVEGNENAVYIQPSLAARFLRLRK